MARESRVAEQIAETKTHSRDWTVHLGILMLSRMLSRSARMLRKQRKSVLRKKTGALSP